MDAVRLIREKAKKNKKKIILPEANDARVLKATEIIKQEKIAEVILLKKENLDAKKIEQYTSEFYEIRKDKGLDFAEAKEIMQDPLYYGAMMVREGLADGFVAGASHTTPDVAKAAIYCLGVEERFQVVSSAFIMSVPDCDLGENGVFVFADCGIVPEPTARQLSCIAVSAAELARDVLGFSPRVAMLSYSTKGSSKGRNVDKVKEALNLAKQLSPGLLIDGELQVDAAIVPEVAKIKEPQSKLAGKANVLIFPDLDAGNIGYKLVQRLAKARAIGPILDGLNHPCCDLSRGCEVDDIVDCAAVTAIKARVLKPR